jgi:hypothetical protein
MNATHRNETRAADAMTEESIVGASGRREILREGGGAEARGKGNRDYTESDAATGAIRTDILQ